MHIKKRSKKYSSFLWGYTSFLFWICLFLTRKILLTIIDEIFFFKKIKKVGFLKKSLKTTKKFFISKITDKMFFIWTDDECLYFGIEKGNDNAKKSMKSYVEPYRCCPTKSDKSSSKLAVLTETDFGYSKAIQNEITFVFKTNDDDDDGKAKTKKDKKGGAAKKSPPTPPKASQDAGKSSKKADKDVDAKKDKDKDDVKEKEKDRRKKEREPREKDSKDMKEKDDKKEKKAKDKKDKGKNAQDDDDGFFQLGNWW